MVKPTGKAFAKKHLFAKMPVWTKIIFDSRWKAVIGVVFLQVIYTGENGSNQKLSCRKTSQILGSVDLGFLFNDLMICFCCHVWCGSVRFHSCVSAILCKN